MAGPVRGNSPHRIIPAMRTSLAWHSGPGILGVLNDRSTDANKEGAIWSLRSDRAELKHGDNCGLVIQSTTHDEIARLASVCTSYVAWQEGHQFEDRLALNRSWCVPKRNNTAQYRPNTRRVECVIQAKGSLL